MADYRDRIGKSKDKQTAGLLSGIGGAIDDVTDTVGGAADTVSDTVDDVSQGADDAFSSFPSPDIPDVGGEIDDAVDDVTDEVGDAVDDVDVPDIDVPDVDVPDVDVPDIDVPDIDVPDIDVPDIDTPDVDSAFDDATDVFDSAQEDISGAFDDTVGDEVDNISSNFDDVFSDVSESADNIFDDAVSDIDESASSVFEDATSATDGIFDDVQEEVQGVQDTAEGAFDDFQEGADNIFSDIDETVDEGIEGATDFADNPAGAFEGAFDDVSSQVDEAIDDAGETIDEFQQDPFGEAAESAQNVADTVRDLTDSLTVNNDNIVGGGLPSGQLINPELGEDLIEGIRNQQIVTKEQLFDVASYGFGPLGAAAAAGDLAGEVAQRIGDVKLPSVNLPSAQQILAGAAEGVTGALQNPFGFALQQFAAGNIQDFAKGLNAAILGNNNKSQGGQFSADENPYGNDGGYAWGQLQTAKELEGCVIMKQEAQKSNATRYFTVAPVQDSEMLRVIGPSGTARVSQDSFSDPDALPYWIGETTQGRSAYDLAIEACPEYDPQEQGDPEDRFDGPRDENERQNGKEGSWSNDLTPVEQTEQCVVLEQPNSNGSTRYLTAGQENGSDVIYQPDGSAVPVNDSLEWGSVEGAQTVSEALTYCPGYEEEEGGSGGQPPAGGQPPTGGEPPEDEGPTEEEPTEEEGEEEEGDTGTEWRQPEEVRTTPGGCVLFRQLNNTGGSRYFTFTEEDGALVAVDDNGETTPVQEDDTQFSQIPSFDRISAAEEACGKLDRNQEQQEDEDGGAEEPQEEQWQEPTVAAETGRCVILVQESNMGNSRYFTITKIDGEKVAMVPGSGEAVSLSGNESFSEIPSFTTLQAAQDACPTQGQKPSEEETQEEIDNRDPDDTSGGLGLGGITPAKAVGGLALLGVGGAVVLGGDKNKTGMSSMQTGNDESLFGNNGSSDSNNGSTGNNGSPESNNGSSGNNGSNNSSNNGGSENGPGQSLFGE